MAEQVSQSRIYIDIGGTGGQAQLLKQVQSMDIKDGRSTEVTVTIGGFKGFRRKEGGFELTLECYREVGTRPEVNWRGLKASKRIFTLIEQDEDNGERMSWRCQVSKIDHKSDSDGNHMDTVAIAATDEFPSLLSFLE